MRKQLQASSFDELWSLIGGELPKPDVTGDQESGNNEPVDSEVHDRLPMPALLNDEAFFHLDEIREFASWNGEDGERKLIAAKTIFLERYPGNETKVAEAGKKGVEDAELFNNAYKLGKNKKSCSEINSLLEKQEHLPEFVRNKALKSYKKGLSVALKLQEESRKRKKGEALSSIKSRPMVGCSQTAFPAKPIVAHPDRSVEATSFHPNDIRSLKPADKWTMVIDETGDQFTNNASGNRRGKFVSILIADGNKLAHLDAKWHAVDCDSREIDRVVQALLDSPVGILGIDVLSVPSASGEKWFDAIALLVDWVLRLLPLNIENKGEHQKTTCLDVLIEQRGVFNYTIPEGALALVRRECLRKLALAFPARAARIELRLNFIAKSGSPYNGYVDAVAYTWGRRNQSSCDRLKKSGWQGTCLISPAHADVRKMLHAWDLFEHGSNLPPSIWWDILKCPDSANPASLLTSFLGRFGEEAKESPAVWKTLLQEVKSRMADSPVDLYSLASAVDWLKKYKPVNSAIPPTAELIWLTVRLARANHLGETENKWMDQIKRSGDMLLDENAPLVCHADLHIAVNATNRFDFDTAEHALARWKSVAPAVPSLLYWGQVRSSLGQHAAFRGDNEKAINLFQEALSAFDRLSDPDERANNKAQTGCYLVVSMMDSSQYSDSEVRSAITQLLGELPDAAVKLAGSENMEDRYKQHLLLRWLVYRSGNEDVRNAYLAAHNQWFVGQGYPWPLILLYRGILEHEHNPDAAVKLAMMGAESAFQSDQGTTVRFIGACCRAVAVAWGNPWRDAGTELANLTQLLPMAVDRIEQLRQFLGNPGDPVEMLKSTLPFNFR